MPWCIDCGKELGFWRKGSTGRCRSCHAKTLTRFDGANPAWKGDQAGIGARHDWIRLRKPKTGQCEWCGAKRYTELHNISGEYKRDLKDWVELCKPCHKKETDASQV